MAFIYQWETVDAIEAELAALLSPEYAAAIPLHRNFYRAMESIKCLELLTARQDSRLVGMCLVVLLPPPLHHGAHLMAMASIWYVAPTHRRRGIGDTLLMWMSARLMQRKVVYWHLGAPTQSALRPWLRAHGWVPTEQTYGLEMHKGEMHERT